MILISFSIALIAIVFGAKLLAQSKKETLGGLYKGLAWFVIIMGLLVLLCDGTRGFMGMCHRGEGRMMDREYMMMDRGGDGMMGGNCPMMMNCHRGDMCHAGEMMGCCGNNSNCGMMSGGSCSDKGMMNCKDDGKGGSSCNAGGGMGASCTMGGKADSVKAKK